MADKTITDLDFAPGSVNDSNTFFVVMQGGAAYKLTGSAFYTAMAAMYNAHGAIASIEKTGTSGQLVDIYTISFADHTTTTFTVTNGNGVTDIKQYFARSTSGTTAPSSGWSTTKQTLTSTYKYLWSYFVFTTNNSTFETTKAVIGAYGDTGAQTYVHIRYASSCSGNPPRPASDSDMGTTGDNWMGVYSGTASTAPTTRASYTWFKVKGEEGEPASLSSQSITYQASSSGTTVPSGTWTTNIPTVPQGNYLWARIVLTFNSGSPVTYYTVTRYAVDGQGAAGTEVPLADTKNGAVGTSLSFARQDHRHPLPTASDILMESGESVETTVSSLVSQKNAVFIGDSYVQANSLSPQTSRFSTVLSGLLGVTEFNYGIGGSDWLAPSGSTFITQLNNANSGMTTEQKTNTKYVFICGGRNVPYNTPSYTYNQLKTAVDACNTRAHQLFPNATIILVPMLWGSDALNFDYKTFETNIEDICYNAKFNGFYVKNAFTWLQGYEDCILADGVHPNVTGHQIIATNIFNALNGNFHFKPFQRLAITNNGVTATINHFDNVVTVVISGTPSIDLAFGAMLFNDSLGSHSGLVTHRNVNFAVATRSGKAYSFQVLFEQDEGNTYLKIQYLGNTVSAGSDTFNGSVILINGV